MIQRRFILGSEWLYCKIYTGEKNADTILSQDIIALNSILFNQNAIDKFFFIRYNDEYFHIRLRYHITSPEKITTIINSLFQKFNLYIQNRRIQKLTYDTYIREVERYGASSYEYTENLFSIDSQSILLILNYIYPLPNKNDLRWKIALLLLDDTLNAASYTLEQKRKFVEKRRDTYRQEFGIISIETIKQFNDKFRANRADIEDAMQRNLPEEILHILNDRKSKLMNIFQKLENILENNLDDYLSSITHMTINRSFITKNRLCELVLFDYLYRYYDSYIAQLKYRK